VFLLYSVIYNIVCFAVLSGAYTTMRLLCRSARSGSNRDNVALREWPRNVDQVYRVCHSIPRSHLRLFCHALVLDASYKKNIHSDMDYTYTCTINATECKHLPRPLFPRVRSKLAALILVPPFPINGLTISRPEQYSARLHLPYLP
jgi:hypothetical protein